MTSATWALHNVDEKWLIQRSERRTVSGNAVRVQSSEHQTLPEAHQRPKRWRARTKRHAADQHSTRADKTFGNKTLHSQFPDSTALAVALEKQVRCCWPNVGLRSGR